MTPGRLLVGVTAHAYTFDHEQRPHDMTMAHSCPPESADAPEKPATDKPQGGWLTRPGARHALFAFAWLNVGAGAVGVVVPGLPTTVFLIIALWAFSKSSDRFHNWLYTHPRFGPPLRDWTRHGVISSRAKLLAISVMTLSLVILAVVAENWILPLVVAAVVAPIAVFILTRPGQRQDH